MESCEAPGLEFIGKGSIYENGSFILDTSYEPEDLCGSRTGGWSLPGVMSD
jgi:hypothetical protein